MAYSASCVVYNGHRPGAYAPGDERKFRAQHRPGLGCGEKHRSARSGCARLARWPVYVAGEAQHPRWAAGVPYGMYCRWATSPSADIRPWFARAGIYALPAVYEPFGLSVLEAALSGCALVLGDIPSLREIWGDAALFVPPSDHEALALGDQSSDANRANCERVGASERVNEHATFTIDRMVHSYLGVYPQARARFRAAKEAGHHACRDVLSLASL